MKKTLFLVIGLTLSLLSCKKDNNDDVTPANAFPKTIIEEAIGNIGTIKTTESYTLHDNKITAFERKVVDNGTPTIDNSYTITYNGDLITAISIKNNSQSNRNYTYTFAYKGNALESITRNDNAQKILYQYANGKVATKTTTSGTETKVYSYTYESNKITMIAHNSDGISKDHFTYTLNDGAVTSLETITYLGNIPDASTKGSCSYAYDNKPNIYQRDLFKYLAEIEIISNYNYYGTHNRDPLIKTTAHNVTSFTKNLKPNLNADYNDLENATRTFSYEWNANNTPKSMEYKKNNAHKATYTYTY